MRALTALKQAGLSVQNKDNVGLPEEMPLEKIHPDPNNSRRPEDENSPEGIEEQRELTQDIKKRGVKSPLSLRPHPAIAGEYMVNFGHRRLIGAREAGLATIPYFLDVSFDSYDQVKENLLHRKPSVWALAQFVQRKLDEKQSKSEIADGLGKANQNFVTELLALVDAPGCLHRAYTSGVHSTRTLYDLRRAYDVFPDQVDAWCASGVKITRIAIQELLDHMRDDPIVLSASANCTAQARADVQPRHDDEPVDLVSPLPIRTPPALSEASLADSLLYEAPPLSDQSVQKPEALRLRHDVKIQERSGARGTSSMPSKSPGLSTITVEYKGSTATVAPDATLKILVKGSPTSVVVPVSDLLIKNAH